MICPYCRISVSKEQKKEVLNIHQGKNVLFMFSTIWRSFQTNVGLFTLDCPECKNTSLYMSCQGRGGYTGGYICIIPRSIPGDPCPSEVTAKNAEIAQVYEEARAVLQDSPRASAALSRTCLGMALRDLKFTGKTLEDVINDAIASRKISQAVCDRLDEIRHIGNWAVHPEKSKDPSVVVPIEPGEAEWLLETIYLLFEDQYVLPAKAAAKKAAFNQKFKPKPTSPPPPASGQKP